jgi:putative transposase
VDGVAAASARHGGRHPDAADYPRKTSQLVLASFMHLAATPMSAPRLITPGATYLVTRRCTQRQFLLRPSAQMNRTFLYCLAYAAARTGVEVHAVVAMSNHWHGVVTDREGRLPEFLQILHRLVAAVTNTALGRVENFWAAEAPSAVVIDHPDDVLDKLAYLITNPVAAGLVKDPSDWPGLITTRLAETLVVDRPELYFRKDGAMPARLKLVCTLPPALRALGIDAVARRLRLLVQNGVRHAKNALRHQGRGFLGSDGVRMMPMSRGATTRETMRKRRPSFASSDPQRREAARQRLRVFRQAYRVAFDRWRAGQRTVRFPEGTYQMRVLHAACCGPPPLP